MMTRFTSKALLICVISALCLLVGCTGPNAADAPKTTNGKKVRIGFLMDSLQQERWQKDHDVFVKRAEELGADVIVQWADGSDEAQINQAQSLILQGVDVLVLVPHNAEVAGTIVDAAHREKIPIISYDRLVKNSEPDLYVSFDNEKVGELQAKYLLDHQPKGNYVLIGGAPTDNNALLLRQGQMKVLQPAIDRGDIKIVADQWAREWLAEEALKHVENALTQNNNDVAAVVVSNDGTAGGVVQALNAKGLAGKVLVSGQDADLAALQRIVGGKQSMTVYKPIHLLAAKGAEVAVAMAKGEKPETTRTVNNGRIEVPFIHIEPISVDKENMDETVIKDGYQQREAIYRKQ